MMHCDPTQGKIRKDHSRQPAPFGQLTTQVAIHYTAVP
jgi:hypothetical protein